jgi:hypothetical protein
MTLPRGLVLAIAGLTGSCAGDASTATDADELTHAAESTLAFLRGVAAFDAINLADTVTLYISPEGGGAHVRVPRDGLREPASWRVPTSRLGPTYAFVPPAGNTELTARVGRHLNCLEYPLSSRYPDLAQLPHVGTMLAPPDRSSCLETWNLTFVFLAQPGPPTLTAVVYDQWEW